MTHIDNFKKFVDEKFRKSNYSSLMLHYKSFVQQYNDLSESVATPSPTSATRSKVAGAGFMFKGVFEAVSRDSSGEKSQEKLTATYNAGKDYFSVIQINIAMMLHFTSLILDKVSKEDQNSLGFVIASFVKGSSNLLHHEFHTEWLSINDRVDMMNLINAILSHKNLSKRDEPTIESLRSIGLTLFNSLSASSFSSLVWMDLEPKAATLWADHSLKVALLDKSLRNADSYRYFHEVYMLQCKELISVPINKFIDFILSKSQLVPTDEVRKKLCLNLMAKFKEFSEMPSSTKAVKPAKAAYYNAMIDVAVQSAHRMKAFLQVQDIEWLKDARLYDCSYVLSPEYSEDKKKYSLASCFSVSLIVMYSLCVTLMEPEPQTDEQSQVARNHSLLRFICIVLSVGTHYYTFVRKGSAMLVVVELPKTLTPDLALIQPLLDATVPDTNLDGNLIDPDNFDDASVYDDVDDAHAEDDIASVYEDADDGVPEKESNVQILNRVFANVEAEISQAISSSLISASPYKTDIREERRRITDTKLPYRKNDYVDHENDIFNENAYRMDLYKAHIDLLVKYPTKGLFKNWNQLLLKSTDTEIRAYWETSLTKNNSTEALEEWKALNPKPKPEPKPQHKVGVIGPQSKSMNPPAANLNTSSSSAASLGSSSLSSSYSLFSSIFKQNAAGTAWLAGVPTNNLDGANGMKTKN